MGFFARLSRRVTEAERPGLRSLFPLYLAGGTFFMILHLNGSAMTQWARDQTDRTAPEWVPALFKQEALPSYYLTAGPETPRPDPRSLAVAGEELHARMFGQQQLDAKAVAAILAANPELAVVELPLEDDGGQPSVVAKRAARVYAEGVVSVVESTDSHGAKTVSVQVPEGSKPERRVAFTRVVEGAGAIGVFVVSRGTHDALYAGFEAKHGRAPTLLAPGTYLYTINAEIYQSLNAAFVIGLTPLVVWLWGRRAASGRPVPTASKLVIGMGLTTASLLVMVLGGTFTDDGSERVSSLWLVGFYGVVTAGELCLSPMGLSLVTKLTPARLVGVAMGGWFLASAFGNNFSGFFGGVQGKMSPVAFFALLAGLASLVTVYLRWIHPRLDKAIRQYGG
jgi:dipeptide/tripeptide permease